MGMRPNAPVRRCPMCADYIAAQRGPWIAHRRYCGHPKRRTFELDEDEGWIRCNWCGKTSYNRNDVRNRYCGNCRRFHPL